MSLLPGVQGPSGYSTGRGEWKNLCQRRRHSRFQQGISGTPAFQIVVMDTRVSSGRLVHWNGREIGFHKYVALPRRAVPRRRAAEDRLNFYLRGRMRRGSARRVNAPYCEPSFIYTHHLLNSYTFGHLL